MTAGRKSAKTNPEATTPKPASARPSFTVTSGQPRERSVPRPFREMLIDLPKRTSTRTATSQPMGDQAEAIRHPFAGPSENLCLLDGSTLDLRPSGLYRASQPHRWSSDRLRSQGNFRGTRHALLAAKCRHLPLPASGGMGRSRPGDNGSVLSIGPSARKITQNWHLVRRTAAVSLSGGGSHEVTLTTYVSLAIA